MNASDTNELTFAPCVDFVILQTWQPSIFTDNLSGMRDYFKIGRGSAFPRSLMFYSSLRSAKEIDYQSSPEEPKRAAATQGLSGRKQNHFWTDAYQVLKNSSVTANTNRDLKKGLHSVVTMFQLIQRLFAEKVMLLMGVQLTPLRQHAYKMTEANWDNAQFYEGQMLQLQLTTENTVCRLAPKASTEKLLTYTAVHTWFGSGVLCKEIHFMTLLRLAAKCKIV